MNISTVASCCCLAASLSDQSHLELPVTAGPSTELPNYSLAPLMQPDSRVQMFYDANEVGSASFVATELSLRYDGPIPQVGAPGPFTITHLQVRIGTTMVPMPGARFADNLTSPLTTVFDAPWTYYPDPGSASPHPWGAPNGSLTIPFSSPAPITIPTGGWLCVEIVMEGNNIASFGFSHAILDGATTTGGITNGGAANYGAGCSAGSGLPAASVSSSGVYAPGNVHFLNGQHLGANAPVLCVFGLSNTIGFAPLPFTLPGTSCSLLASADFTSALLADASGSVTGNRPETALALPADPAIDGYVIYEQMASLVATANPWGIVFSDAVAVTLGSFAPLGRGTYTVLHDLDANATFANSVKPFGFAMRLTTL